MSRFILDPTRPFINPHDSFVEIFMKYVISDKFIWDWYYIDDDDIITICYHTYENAERIYGMSKLTLTELKDIYYAHNQRNI
jgi:hypothetical protein